jgi:hypothetical protein
MRHAHLTAARSLSPVRALAAIAAACALLLAAAPGAEAKPVAKVPPNFVGMVGDGPLLHNGWLDSYGEFDTMVKTGVQSLRAVFEWNVAQPYRSFADVPADQRDQYRDEGGVPTSYYFTDILVAAAAKRHMSVLPTVLTAPDWDARHPGKFNSPPARVKPYADYMAALVHRYGPGGSFWAEHPELSPQPIRHWQIWNEPSLTAFWSDQPFAKDYVKLLRASRTAVKRADSGAKIVLAGLPNKSWEAMGKLYRAGARGLFDVATFHPFTAQVAGVRTILERDRRVMTRYRDKRTPIWVTELSWTSAKGKTQTTYGNETTERGQASRLTGAYTMLARERRKLNLQRVYWYTWLTRDLPTWDYPFDYAGLSAVTADGHDIRRKPAFTAFRRIALKLERCRTKTRADRCAS